MIKSYFFICVSFVVIPYYGISQQNFVNNKPFYRDSKLVSHYVDSLTSSGVDTSLIYLTKEKGAEVTYLIWLIKNKMNVLKFTDTSVSQAIENKAQTFSSAIKPYEIAILKREDKLKFIPPVNLDLYEVAIVQIKKQNYLVERGDVRNYILDKRRLTKREFFFTKLKQSLSKLNNNFEFAFSYVRPT